MSGSSAPGRPASRRLRPSPQDAEHLYVFQRTPAYSLPANNRPLPADYEREWKEQYPQRRAEMRAELRRRVPAGPAVRIGLRLHPGGTNENPEEAWAQRDGLLFLRTFTDTMRTLEANEITAEFIRGKIRQIVKDPDVAEMLCPKTYPVGTKRSAWTPATSRPSTGRT